MYDFLAGNNYPNSPNSQGGYEITSTSLKYTTDIRTNEWHVEHEYNWQAQPVKIQIRGDPLRQTIIITLSQILSKNGVTLPTPLPPTLIASMPTHSPIFVYELG